MKERKDIWESEIEEFIEVANKITQGNWGRRVRKKGSQPIDKLATAFNQMLDALETRQKELQNYIEAANHALFELRRAYEELTTLQLLSVTINTTFEINEILTLFINLIQEIIDYRACILMIPEREDFTIRMERNVSPTLRRAIESPTSRELMRWCCKENKVVPFSWQEFTGKKLRHEKEGDISYILIPIISHNKAIGVLVLECPIKEDNFTQQQLTLLSLLAAQTAIACENADLYRDMQQKNIDLVRLKNYLQNILVNVSTGIIVLDKQGQITNFNRMSEKLFGINSSEVIGKPFYDVFKEPLRETIRHILMSSMLDKQVDNYELDYSLDGSRSVSLAFSSSLLRDENEVAIGFVIVCRDISETKELDAMRKLSQLKTEFISNISHELRTPLTSIKAYTETLLNKLERMPIDVVLECLGIVDSESERLARLLDDLLDFSRMESGKLKLNKKTCNIKQTFLETIEQMKMQTSKNTFMVNVPSESITVEIDKDRIKQALINIISNAIKYSPNGGDINCLLEDKGKEIFISVEDQGIGIPEESLPYIFEKFYRVEGQTTYQIGGTGLGLPITKTIIEAHNGRISVESQLNKGTKISFILPKNNT